jgi:hypothetical protein
LITSPATAPAGSVTSTGTPSAFGGVDATCRFGHAHAVTGEVLPAASVALTPTLAPLYTGGFSVTL